VDKRTQRLLECILEPPSDDFYEILFERLKRWNYSKSLTDIIFWIKQVLFYYILFLFIHSLTILFISIFGYFIIYLFIIYLFIYLFIVVLFSLTTS
jgi:hypothetical protein